MVPALTEHDGFNQGLIGVSPVHPTESGNWRRAHRLHRTVESRTRLSRAVEGRLACSDSL